MIVKMKFIKEPERLEVFNFLNLYFSRKHLQLRNSLSSAAHFNPVNLRLSFDKITRSLSNQVPLFVWSFMAS